MWSKLSNAMGKSRTDDSQAHSQVHQHPNTSSRSLVSNTDAPLHRGADDTAHTSGTPPSSPSKAKRLLKRMSRTPIQPPKFDHEDDREEETGRSSPFKFPITLPKRVKSHLHLNGNSSQASLSRPSTDSAASSRPSYDTLRSVHESQDGHSPIEPDENDTARSPLATGSVRSIMRVPKTPGTGQSVRFFSRDAYRVISPDASLTSTVQEPVTLLDQFQAATMPVGGSASKARRPGIAMDLFTPPKDHSALTTPIPSADLSGMFGADIPPIHPAAEDSLLPPFDSSVDNSVAEGGFTSTPHKDHAAGEVFHSMSMALSDVVEEDQERHQHQDSLSIRQEPQHHLPLHIDTTSNQGQTATPPSSAREVPLPASAASTSTSFSFGQTVFYSMSKPNANTPASAPSSGPSSEKSRLSDSSSIFRAGGMGMGVFTRQHRHSGGSVSTTSTTNMVESDINDESADSLALGLAFDENEKAREKQKQRDRDEPDPFRANATTYYTPQTLIPPTPPQSKNGSATKPGNVIHARAASKEEDVIWSLRTQLALQQELCAQYEIDLSARDALVNSLTERVGTTEKEGERRKGVLRGWKKKVNELERMCRGLQEEVDRSREESFERSVMDEASGEALKSLQQRIGGHERVRAEAEKRAEKAEATTARLESVIRLFGGELLLAKDREERGEDMEYALAEERESQRVAQENWDEERALLIMRGAQVENSRAEIAEELVSVQEVMQQKDNEYGVLQAELEAQWAHTEKGTERIEELERQKVEVEAMLVEEQAHAESMTSAMEAQDVQLADAQAEHAFAQESVARLEENIRQRDAEIVDFSARVVEREITAEQLREEMATLRREHVHLLDEQARVVKDSAGLEDGVRREMEEMVRARAEADVLAGTLKERVAALKEEMERLRRQVHELQQESADKEMSLVQLAKQRAQDKADMSGLNIALDSKQQELELLKRKLGVKGTAGSTPGPAKIAHTRRESSSGFATPGVVRPPSALSDIGREGHRGLETPVPIPKALARSVRTNASTTATPKAGLGSMGPPSAKVSRPSVGTPTPTASRMARSTSAKPAVSSPIVRRPSTMEQARIRAGAGASGRKISESSAPSELDEKENVDEPARAPVGVVRRRVSEMQIAGA